MKHEIALGKNGIVYYPQDIRDKSKLVDMRYYGITTRDETFELVAVNPNDISVNPFFRFKVSPGKDCSRVENSPSHDFVKSELLAFLKAHKTLRVYTKDKFDKEVLEDKLAICYFNEENYNYSWFSESFEKLNKDNFVRWDILGRNTVVGNPTSKFPNLIFEIIQSSFPSHESFRYMCEKSIDSESVFILLFISEMAHKRKGKSFNFYWNDFEFENDLLNIRCVFYIKHGFLYKNSRQVEDYLNTKSSDGEIQRRFDFKTYIEADEYWKKSWLYVRDNYFKKAIHKFAEK
jgi:hypothetical protein